MHDHKRLRVWRQGRDLVTAIYEVTRGFPSDERFGLTAQLRRAAVSIPSNIAEGAGRGGDKWFAHFLRIASGSAAEVETQLLLAGDLGFCDEDALEPLIEHVRTVKRMLWGMRQRIQSEAMPHGG